MVSNVGHGMHAPTNVDSQAKFGSMLVFCFGTGLVLQYVVPVVLNFVGFKRAALWAMLPGLYPVLIATHGWFASLSAFGVVILFGINTVVYSLLVFCIVWFYREVKKRFT